MKAKRFTEDIPHRCYKRESLANFVLDRRAYVGWMFDLLVQVGLSQASV